MNEINNSPPVPFRLLDRSPISSASPDIAETKKKLVS
jgi:hypothetical protein